MECRGLVLDLERGSTRSGYDALELTNRITPNELEAVCGRTDFSILRIRDARSLTDLSPLAGLNSLRELTVNLPFLVTDLTPLGRLTSLRALWYGNGNLGNDKVVAVPDLRWTRTLVGLERIEFVGTRLVDPDLSPLLDLPNLREISLPLRRGYRRRVFDYAKTSTAFAGLAAKYEAFDEYRAERGLIKLKLPDLDSNQEPID